MNKTIIEVPGGIRYIGDWEEFNDIFPRVPHIMDKAITGCGFTEWCLTNNRNVVLCSPRNILLDNKAEQHPGEVYRVRSEFFDKELGVDKDITNNSKIRPVIQYVESSDVNRESISMCSRVRDEYDTYVASRGIKPKKILVTYDSFHVVKSVLQEKGILHTFTIIVDEFQSIFTDSRFKADTEMEFIGDLKGINNVCFLSATPMMDQYLSDIPEFKDLPYYELDWESKDKGRVMSPSLEVRAVRSIYEPAKDIIEKLLIGNFEHRYYTDEETGELKIIESKEVVFYVNSVTNILGIINRCNLTPDQVNILCAKTEKNEKLVKNRLGKGWEIGKVPLENEPRKMFTFCTRTVYLGADFYSPCASSVILSDASVECLAVDISLDLPQILGRQRLWENPWKTTAKFFYKPIKDSNEKLLLTRDEFEEKIKLKLEATDKLLRAYDSAPIDTKDALAIKYYKDVFASNYKGDYVGVNGRGQVGLKPKLNNLVLIAERRAYDIQQIDYKDRFSVINATSGMNIDTQANEINLFFAELDNKRTTYEKLKFICEAELSEETRKIVEDRLDVKFKSYLALGKDRLKALGYNSTKITKELINSLSDNQKQIREKVLSGFHVGDRLTKQEIRDKLKEIYGETKENHKATDLEKWFKIKRAKVNGQEGFKILGVI